MDFIHAVSSDSGVSRIHSHSGFFFTYKMKDSINLNIEIKSDDKFQEILRTGDFSKGRSGLKFTKKDLEKVVENFNNNVIDSGMKTASGASELPVNIDHLYGGAERDAAGWIVDLRIENNDKKGHSLMAKIRWTELGIEKVSKELFRGFSVEIHTKDSPYLNSETGDKTPFVLTGLALTNEPFISGMKAAELSAKAEALITNLSKNMDTIKIMLSSLRDADKVTRSELELLNKAVECLSDDEKEEVKEDVEAVETKVEETEAQEKEAEKEAEKTEEEKKELSRLAKDKDAEVTKLSKKLSEVHSELDKVKLERRAEKTQLAVEKLSSESKIVGEKIVEKTVEMLLSKSDKDADEMLSFLDSQPSRLSTEEIGGSVEDTTEAKTELLAQTRAKELMSEGLSKADALIQAYKEIG